MEKSKMIIFWGRIHIILISIFSEACLKRIQLTENNINDYLKTYKVSYQE